MNFKKILRKINCPLCNIILFVKSKTRSYQIKKCLHCKLTMHSLSRIDGMQYYFVKDVGHGIRVQWFSEKSYTIISKPLGFKDIELDFLLPIDINYKRIKTIIAFS